MHVLFIKSRGYMTHETCEIQLSRLPLFTYKAHELPAMDLWNHLSDMPANLYACLPHFFQALSLGFGSIDQSYPANNGTIGGSPLSSRATWECWNGSWVTEPATNSSRRDRVVRGGWKVLVHEKVLDVVSNSWKGQMMYCTGCVMMCRY